MKTNLLMTIFSLAAVTGLLRADDKAAPQKAEQDREKATTTELHVTGMSCHNCADAIEDALAALGGVEVESVDAKSNLAMVKYDPAKVAMEKLVAAVKASGGYVLEKTVEYDKLEYENDGSFSLDGKAFTGTATDTHKKNSKRSKNYQFKDGQLHGLIREWYDNGQIGAKKFYKAGKRHGKTEYWDESGKLTATKIYQDDVHVDEAGKEVAE
jgi:copper chaperone CopZ